MAFDRIKAVRLWEKTLGGKACVKDYAGKKMDKFAFNDVSSEMGWALDLIVPKRNGGKETPENMICCSLQTIAERAGQYPVFTIEGIEFEAKKDKAGNKIVRLDGHTPGKNEELAKLDFNKAISGTKFYKRMDAIQTKARYVGTVAIRLSGMQSTALVDFMGKFFEAEEVHFTIGEDFSKSETRVVVKAFNLPAREENQKLLDKCVVLNTYLQKYFLPLGLVDAYEVFYRLDYYPDKQEMYVKSHSMNFNNYVSLENREGYFNCLLVNSNVINCTDAGKSIKDNPEADFVAYDAVLTTLAEALEKEVKKERKGTGK